MQDRLQDAELQGAAGAECTDMERCRWLIRQGTWADAQHRAPRPLTRPLLL